MRAFTRWPNPVLVLFTLCIAASAVAAGELSVVAVPEWVTDRQLSLETELHEPSDEPVDILIDDQQVVFEPGHSTQFSHGALRANSVRAAGLAASHKALYALSAAFKIGPQRPGEYHG